MKYLLGVVLAALVSTAAIASPNCHTLEHVNKSLSDNYGESVAFRGVEKTGKLFLLYVNKKSTTWTVVMARSKNYACLAVAGEGIIEQEQSIPNEGT